jgi:hypothetical protein
VRSGTVEQPTSCLGLTAVVLPRAHRRMKGRRLLRAPVHTQRRWISRRGGSSPGRWGGGLAGCPTARARTTAVGTLVAIRGGRTSLARDKSHHVMEQGRSLTSYG